MVVLKFFIPFFISSVSLVEKNVSTFPNISKIFMVLSSSFCTYQPIYIWFLHVKSHPYHFTEAILIRVISVLYMEWSRPILDLVLLSSWVILDTVDCCCFLKYSLCFCDVLSPVCTFASLTAFS